MKPSPIQCIVTTRQERVQRDVPWSSCRQHVSGDHPLAANSERLGSEHLGSERLGNERLGNERLGNERLGSERLGSERLVTALTPQ